MKLSRRKMLGTLAATAATGKQALEETAKQIAANVPMVGGANAPMPSFYNLDKPMESMFDEGKFLADIKQTQDLAGGKLLPWMEDELTNQRRRMGRLALDVGYSNFKSVSEPVKRIWEQDRDLERTKANWIEDAKKRLVNLLKEKVRRGIFG